MYRIQTEHTPYTLEMEYIQKSTDFEDQPPDKDFKLKFAKALQQTIIAMFNRSNFSIWI